MEPGRAQGIASELRLALAICAVGLLGALRGGTGPTPPQAFLAWLALCALPLGLIAGGLGLRGLLPLVAVSWLVALTWLARGSGSTPHPLHGWAAATGLFALAAGAGALVQRAPWRAAALAACAVGLAAALPTGAGVLEQPWPPALAARLFDLSPVTLVEECAGLDWLRERANYAPLGADSIDPALRHAWRGAIAAPVLFALGALAFGAAGLRVRRARAREQGALR